ncbi:iron-sulfur cluster assembly accessory protein [Oscillatoriales cyanobacterium LEGE 11467]|uniref:Iron-sulfur cluster assembly accessory protein n=1 Tax=Zarconia navalis LEGE 11467 TaxID=1828826 RepID=A0A928VY64_9CYAN|nr:iron-sulfur cluster assembly accessory protein [Zarconia navalis]MBE9040303.1 iron-sulfur cluster assembly accessory protein [Zarconia navalis LEGE 11467]
MIHLSQAAIRELKRLKSRQNSQEAYFRLKVEAGGCSEFFYAMTFDETAGPSDRVCECEGLETLIDSVTLPYVEGLTVDYSEDLMGGGFRFHNPNATQTCGCGNSFAMKKSGNN